MKLNFMSKKVGYIFGGVLVLILIFGFFYVKRAKQLPSVAEFPLVASDSIGSWDFKGSHNDNGVLENKVRDDISRLTKLLGSKTYTDYELYISLASEYELLGDGRHTYEFLNRALAIDSVKTGIAWHNMGKLMTRLGALNTARVAFQNAVKAESGIVQFHIAYLDFLLEHFPSDRNAILKAIESAGKDGGLAPASLTRYQDFSQQK